MSGSSATPTPSISPAEMQVLVARAGLTLNPGQMADLVLAWRQMVGLLGLIPRDRPLLDDQAFVFRLPPPVAAVAPPGARSPAARKPAARKPAAAKAAAKPARAKPARAKPAHAKPAGRKPGSAKPAPAKSRAGKRTAGKPAARPSARRRR